MACTFTLSGIACDCATSMGGIKRVAITERANVDFSGFVVTDDIITTITMNGSPAETFKSFCIRPESSQMVSTATIDQPNGVNYISTELTLLFSRMDTAKRLEVMALLTNDCAVLVEDCNDKWWFLGANEAVRATAGDGQTGTARGDANRYQVVLTDYSKSMPQEVDASAAVAVIS